MHRHRRRGFGPNKFRRAPVMGGHWRLRQLRQFDFAFQYIEEDKFLRIVIPLPGIDSQSLKVRAKSDVVSISASVKEELQKYAARPNDNWDIALDHDVIPETSKAKYTDGILIVDFELAVPPTKVDINYN